MMLGALSYKTLQWLVFLCVALHNLEEALTAATYLPKVQALLSARAPAGLVVSVPTPSQFYVGLVWVTIFSLVLVTMATTGESAWIKPYLVAFVQAILLLNVFIPHVPAAIVFGGYAPGAISAVVVNLPFSIYFFRRSLRESQITWEGLGVTMVVALGVLALAAKLLYSLGAWAVNA